MANEIGVRLTGDNSAFRAMLAQSAEQAGKFGGDIAGRVGGKLFELKDISNTIATALGINLASIAENIARTITGISKDEEEAFKSLEQISAQVADANIRNARALLTEEQRYQLTLQDRDRLLSAIADNAGKTGAQLLAQKRDELKLAEKVAEIQAYELKQAEERKKAIDEIVKTQVAGNEKQFQAQLALLDGEGRLRAIRESIVAMQAVLASGAVEEKNAKQIQVQLAERQNQLVQERTKLEQAREERKQKERDENAGWLKKKQQLEYEALSTEEKIAKTQESIDTLTSAIAKAKREGVNADQLIVLKMEAQKELAGLLTGEVKERTAAEQAAIDAINKQIKAYAALMERVRQFETRGTAYEGQSTAALEGVRDRVRSQLTQAEQSRFGQIGGVGQIGGLGASPLEYGLRSQLAAIEKELAQRRAVGDVASRFGEDAARSQFGDTLTDRALRDLQDSSTRTANAIADIQQRLAQVFTRK